MRQVLFFNSIRFILLIPLQVFVLDNINLGGFINPYIYILFILMLPFETPGWLLLFLSFLLGFFVDLFSGTPGLHAASSTLIAFARPLVIKSISSSREFEKGMQPSIQDLGLRWFSVYALILSLLHNFSLFLIEVFRFSGFWFTLQRTLYSTFFTLLILILAQLLFTNKSKATR